MEFNLLALVGAVGCCLVSIVIAGWAANKKENKEWLENLKHPDKSFLLKYIKIVGIVFYLMFGYVLYQLIDVGDVVSSFLTAAIVQLMGLCPFFLHKTRNLRLFFFVNLGFLILLPLLIFLVRENLVLAMLVLAYFAFFLYDLSYWYRLMKLNE
ncbi:MAG: tryptophan-rich sensory protein [Defluviitaleaceae bacterium]|nr:tryptophan-rich sensory protein [Defluviitaleaceae bacterium]